MNLILSMNMKKLIISCLCVAALASCNVKNSEEYKALEAERDSLLNISAQNETELADVQSAIEEVEENFRQIRESEKYLSMESQKKGEMSTDTKTRVKENFEMIKEIIKKNKEQLDKLDKQIKNTKGEQSSLKKTLQILRAELEDKTATIIDLQTKLEERDATIVDLEASTRALTENVETLATTTAEQASKIKEQDKDLNAAYYRFGTSGELKEAKIISGGFLASSKLLKENIEKSQFIKIDIRKTTSIPVYAKKAKLMSNHPSDSYTLEKDANDKVVIKITDYNRFWSLTRFLVVEVNV